MNNYNQTNDLEDGIFPEATIQNSNPVITDDSIDNIDLILNSMDALVAPTTTKSVFQKQTAASNAEAMTSDEPNSRSEDTLSGLEDQLQLMTELKLSPYTQSLIQDLVWYEAYRANIKKNREELIKSIANEISGSDNLSRFIKGKFTKETKQILEANGASSEELLNPETNLDN
ncbi:hypothetical protein BDC45DRAFT_508183 [Circinella umbellata]|nr:hypothetical protein BDC45DRAFT_508183 [Circinella umbellata]